MEKSPKSTDDAPLRPHSYDEIEEYDKRLPNWWLWTLFGSIIFSFCYWLTNQWGASTDPVVQKLDREMAQIAVQKANSPGATLTDEELWKMSHAPDIVRAGSETFSVTCASCHGASLEGKIGPNLVDSTWLHGSKPNQILKVIREGVLAKGMPAWGPVLGNQRVSEAAAFILSHHEQSETGEAK